MSDVIVIGGGIAGLSAAAALAPDARVTVLEAQSALAYHASGRSAALFEENYGAPSVVALNKASATHHFEANGGYTTPRGLLITARAEEADDFHADLATLGVDRIDIQEALKLVPILDPEQLAFAGYHAAAYDLDTDRMVQDYARSVRESGGQIITKAPVGTIARLSDGWEVETPQGSFTGTTLINAAGPWADVVAEMAGIAPIGITPLRRSMARIPAPGGLDPRHWPMFFGVGESWYAKPDAGALIVSPAEEDPLPPQDAYADDIVIAEGLARYEAMVSTPVTRVLTTWAGLRSFAPDRTLVLGAEPSDKTFVWCAGQGGYGFQTAPAAGQLIADLVTGRTPSLAADVVKTLAPDRLRA